MDNNPTFRTPTESAAPKVERKKVEKVIKGTARTKKKSGMLKLADVFLPGDISDVKSYIVSDVLVPAVKHIISDTVDTILYNGSRGGSKRSNADRVSYRSYYDRGGKDTRRDAPVRTGYDHEPVIVDTRSEAQDIIAGMDDILSNYGIVSVADMYDLAGISCHYTDNNYGWTNIRSADIIHVRDGYMIKMPKAMPLEK